MLDDRKAWSAIMDDLESQITDAPASNARLEEAQRQDRLIMQAQNEIKTKCR